MAVDKSLMEAPLGIAGIAADMEPIEIEIEIPSEEDGAIIDLMQDKPRAEEFDANLADYMSDVGE
jgi:hypothetical protein